MPLPALQNNNRKQVHLQSPEFVSYNPYTSTNNGSSWAYDKSNTTPFNLSYIVAGVNNIYPMNMDYPQWWPLQTQNSWAAWAYSSGAGIEIRGLGAMGGTFNQTATGGWVGQINTNKTIVTELTGCELRVISGAGAGYIGQVTRVQKGTNAIIYVGADTSPNALGTPTFDATTVFRVYSQSLWFFNPWTTSVWFSVYDKATNQWNTRSVTGLPTSFGTDGQLVWTPSYGTSLLTGTIGTWSTTTVFNLANAWLALNTNQYANHQIRMVTWALKWQLFPLSSTGATSVTSSVTASVAPSNGDQYAIEANDDYFYLMGSNAVALYRNSVSANAWTTLSPTVARAAAPWSGGTMDWLNELPNRTVNGQTISFDLQANWKPLNHYSTTIFRQRGRYLISWRGNNSAIMDIYDISANTWINDVLYSNRFEGIQAGSCSVDKEGYIYIMQGSSGRILSFNFATMELLPFFLNAYPQSTTVVWDKMIITQTEEDSSDLTRRVTHLYFMQHTRSEIHRALLINR